VDNTYQLVEWTNDQLGLVYRDMCEGKTHTLVAKCIFRLEDIRAIVHLVIPEEPEVKEHDKPAFDVDENGMIITELGSFTKEEFELLTNSGIELGEVIGERRNTK